jgi:hypothetical protein
MPCFLARTSTPEEQLQQDMLDREAARLEQDILDLEDAAAKLYFEIHKRRLELHK